MSSIDLFSTSDFPPRLSTHRGNWVPLYLEPVVGSGERICIGVVAEDDQGNRKVARVSDIERLACVYGESARAFTWAADLALAEIEDYVERGGLQALTEWNHQIDGLIIGSARMGAGRSLLDLAQLAVGQVSSLVRPLESQEGEKASLIASPEGTLQRLDAQVRKLVIQQRPQLKGRFGRIFRSSQTTRPLRYGYVGRLLVVNFSSLTARSPSNVGTQVDRAKARLWDLKQLQSGVLADSLPIKATSLSYELLVHRPLSQIGSTGMARVMKEAEEELEGEADKFEMRFRAMRTPEQIAGFIVDREAA